MRFCAGQLAVLLLIFVLIAPHALHESSAAPGPQEVGRIFYLTQLGLNSRVPGGGVPFVQNITKTPLEFNLPSPLKASGASISSPMIFTLYVHSNVTGVDIQLEGTFHEKFGQNQSIDLPSLSKQRIDSTALTKVNFTFNLPSLVLVPFAQLGVSFRIPSPQPRVLVQVFYDSATTPSNVVLTMSSYLILDQNTVGIFDQKFTPTTTFNLNANSSSLSNVVIFQVQVRSLFGRDDVARVNLTIVDPNEHFVRGAMDLDMFSTSLTEDQPFVYYYPWLFPSNATQGVYKVYVDIVDSQNLVAFTYRGPATFILARGLFIPPSLIPYFAAGGVGGVGVVGSLLYYRRRKAKSYLVPFDYFTTLTAGEINSGTQVTIEGNTGSGKTVLSQQLMFEDLKHGRPCVYVATGDFPSNIRSGMKALGLDVTGYEQSGSLTFVDGYSSEAGQESKEKFSIPSLADLTTLGMKITSSLPSGSFKGGGFYFDSLTPLASKTKPESIVSLVQSVGARVKGMSGKAFFTVGPSLDPTVQRQLEELSDCVVQMEAFEEGGVRKSRLKIAKYRARKCQQGWALYTVEDGKGMIFYSKKPQK